MYSTLPRPLTETLEMSCTNSVSVLSAESYRRCAYLDSEVGVQQELEFKALVSLIAYSDHCL